MTNAHVVRVAVVVRIELCVVLEFVVPLTVATGTHVAVLHLLLRLLSQFFFAMREAAPVKVGALLTLLIKFTHISLIIGISFGIEVVLIVLLRHATHLVLREPKARV